MIRREAQRVPRYSGISLLIVLRIITLRWDNSGKMGPNLGATYKWLELGHRHWHIRWPNEEPERQRHCYEGLVYCAVRR